MTIATFDTLRAAKRLKEAGFDERQAETVTDVLRENRDADLSQLATKQDVAMAAQDTQQEFALLRQDMDGIGRRVDRVEALLDRIAARVDETHGFIAATLPTLATKAELADKPGKAYLWGVVAVLVGGILGAVALGTTIGITVVPYVK